MNMIIIHTHPLYLYFISVLYSYCGFSDYFHYISIQQCFPIFHRKHHVVVY